jgi:hypothetical protein
VDGIADDVRADVERARQAAYEGGRDPRGERDRERGTEYDERARADGGDGFCGQEVEWRSRAGLM